MALFQNSIMRFRCLSRGGHPLLFQLNTVLPRETEQRRWMKNPKCHLEWKVKVHWEIPKGVKKYAPEDTGDLEVFTPNFQDSYPVWLQGCKLLETADETTKELLSLNYSKAPDQYESYQMNLSQRVQRHKLDLDSPEVQIAKMTARLRWLQWLMCTAEKRRCKNQFRGAVRKLMDQRRQALEMMRLSDYKCYEWVLEKLQIIHKPKPPIYINIQRRQSLRRLTSEYVYKLKKEKREALHQELKEKQEEFLREKIETLKWIMIEEGDLKVTPTITEKDVQQAEQELEEFLHQKEQHVEKEEIPFPGMWRYDFVVTGEDYVDKKELLPYRNCEQVEEYDTRQ
ncbi:unnamed protein product [Darwinula stevensoni]|uniref:Small ribosomal subunit protein uS15m n=1 Tax=Darwinula stevensoni TaxID=69355 RepID=A0A7R9FRL7_9CRUS|nr:unnamed protein product [Darwinula stevensoni]CAG0901259.1 unnamed protein product [Darwinula stevensoni]